MSENIEATSEAFGGGLLKNFALWISATYATGFFVVFTFLASYG